MSVVNFLSPVPQYAVWTGRDYDRKNKLLRSNGVLRMAPTLSRAGLGLAGPIARPDKAWRALIRSPTESPGHPMWSDRGDRP